MGVTCLELVNSLSTVSPAASDTLCQLMLTSECDITQRSSLSNLLSLTQIWSDDVSEMSPVVPVTVDVGQRVSSV